MAYKGRQRLKKNTPMAHLLMLLSCIHCVRSGIDIYIFKAQGKPGGSILMQVVAGVNGIGQVVDCLRVKQTALIREKPLNNCEQSDLFN